MRRLFAKKPPEVVASVLFAKNIREAAPSRDAAEELAAPEAHQTDLDRLLGAYSSTGRPYREAETFST